MAKKLLLVIAITLLMLEVASRIAVSVLFHTSFFRPDHSIYQYYPELENLKDYHYDPERTNVLILGGSVLYNDTITVEIKPGDLSFINLIGIHRSHFCAPERRLDPTRYNAINLASSAHNSLDSWYKYNYCRKLKFDVVFPYHGINDLRSNNIHQGGFYDHYEHIEFYDDVKVLLDHPEMKYTAVPFAIAWYKHSLTKKKKRELQYIPREFFMGLLTGQPERNVLEGSEVKSAKTFRRNFESIVQLAKEKGETPLLSTYAWNLPDDYHVDSFYHKRLDYYDEQLWPVELYGMPENIRKGLTIHNGIVRDIAKTNGEVRFIDFEGELPKTRQYFNDVCHITDDGCAKLSAMLDSAMAAHR